MHLSVSKKSNTPWSNKRKNRIQIRRENTDSIKEFIEYATSQGSLSPEKYYISFSRMQTSALFPKNKKEKNFRDHLDMHQLSIIEVSDKIISNLIREGI